MAKKISQSKGLDYTPTFDTYVPELSDNADIQNALEYFYYGNAENGNTIDATNSIYSNLVDLDNRISSTISSISGHTGGISDVHGVGAGSEVVGTIKAQTLTNKTLTSPTITSPTITSPSISSPTVTGTATLPSTTSIGNVSSTEISYVDGVTSPIQTQINTNTPVGMISIHAGATAPTGWLLCQGQAVSRTTYSGLFGVVSTTYGSGDGSTTFNLPNLKGRVVVGIDTAQAEFNIRGETGGGMNHQHTASNSGNTSVAHNHTIPALGGSAVGAGAHNHNVNAHSHNTNTTGAHDHPFNGNVSTSNNGVNQGRTTGNTFSTNIPNHSHGDNFNPTTLGDHSHNTNSPTTSTSSDGSNHTHNVGTTASATTDGAGGSHTHTTPASSTLSNLQPYMALNYIIKH
jgi:microcystin-dependent protein